MSIRIIAPAGGNNSGEVDTTPPLAPTGGFLSGFTASQVQVNWLSNSEPDINIYRIYKSTTSSTTGFSLLGEAANHVTSYIDTTYSPTVQSWYRVTAVDNATPGNESAFSSTFFDITAPGTPSIPTVSNVLSTSFTITPPTSSAIDHLTWQYWLSTDNVNFTLQATQNTAYTRSGLTPGATYYVYVRDQDRMGNTSVPSATVSQATTAVSNSVWLSPAEITALPSSGTAYTRLQGVAQSAFGTPDLTALDNAHDTNTLAGALYAAKTSDSGVLTAVRASLASVVDLPTSTVLELARALQSYIIAADLIAYRDPAFISWVTSIIDANIPGHSTANSLRETAQRSANNWGCHARASLAAAAVYLEDATMLADAVQAQQEYIGTYAGGSPRMIFSTTSPDQDWHFNLSSKAGVNRADAGYLSGVLPEEWRRDTGFTAPGTDLASLAGVTSTYLWEGIQGFIVSAVILHREGAVPITAGSNAVQRAIDVLIATSHPALGDDRWIPWLANQYLGTNYDTSAGIQEGKGMGWTDWTGVAGDGTEPSSEPYDLSGFSIPFSYSWPTAPTITSSATVTPATLAANNVNGRRLTLQAGSYGDVSPANDQEWILQAGANIDGFNYSGSVRVKVRGETARVGRIGFISGPNAPSTASDILFDEIYQSSGSWTGTFEQSNAFTGNRIAVVRSSLNCSSYCIFMGDEITDANTDFILAGCFVQSTDMAIAGSADPQSLMRLMSTNTYIIVDNYGFKDTTGLGLRLHTLEPAAAPGEDLDNYDGFIAGNVLVMDSVNGTVFNAMNVAPASSGYTPALIRDIVVRDNIFFNDTNSCVAMQNENAAFMIDQTWINNVAHGSAGYPTIGTYPSFTISGNTSQSYNAGNIPTPTSVLGWTP